MSVVIDGTSGVSLVQDGIVTDSKLNLTANSAEIKEALNAANGAPIYAARAWVNFNGTGTVVIRASGNVSSITDNGTGDYTVNFTTAMPDANYCISTQGYSSGSGPMVCGIGEYSSNGTLSTTSARLYVSYGSTGAKADANVVSVAFHR